MPKKRPARKGTIVDELTMKLEAAATPERVATVARMFAEALDAMGAPVGVTMVVTNLNMGAAIRARTELDAVSISLIAQVVENPMVAVQQRPDLQVVASALARGARELGAHGGSFARGGREIAKFDPIWVESMRAAAKGPQRTLVHGSSEMLSLVIRVGRSDEGRDLFARVLCPGMDVYWDVRIDPAAAADFFAAVQSEAPQRIRFDASWTRTPDGLVLDRETMLLRSTTAWSPLSGFELIGNATIDDEAFDDALANLRGDA